MDEADMAKLKQLKSYYEQGADADASSSRLPCGLLRVLKAPAGLIEEDDYNAQKKVLLDRIMSKQACGTLWPLGCCSHSTH
jgi:hypothetical protein